MNLPAKQLAGADQPVKKQQPIQVIGFMLHRPCLESVAAILMTPAGGIKGR